MVHHVLLVSVQGVQWRRLRRAELLRIAEGAAVCWSRACGDDGGERGTGAESSEAEPVSRAGSGADGT
jgi:hypothetical protein